MLPLYATYNASVFRVQQRVYESEKIQQCTETHTEIELSHCQQLLQNIALEPFELPEKRIDYKSCEYLFDIEVESDLQDGSIYKKKTASESLKFAFKDIIDRSEASCLLLPTIKCDEIDFRMETDILEEEGFLDFMEENAERNYIQENSAASDPLASARIEKFLQSNATISHFTIDPIKDMMAQLARTAREAGRGVKLLETIPLECPLDIFEDQSEQSAISTIMSLLQPKELPPLVPIYCCANGNFTERLLRQAEADIQCAFPRAPTKVTTTPCPTSLLEGYKDVLPTATKISTTTFCGDVGVILPDFFTARDFSSESQCGAGQSSHLALDVLSEMENIHACSLAKPLPRPFLYDTRNQPYFSSVMDRLFDLQSPWELMPVKQRPEMAADPTVALVADTLQELDLQYKPLPQRALSYRPSPLCPAALDALFLYDGEYTTRGQQESSTKRKKVHVASGVQNEEESLLSAQMREFVRVAALEAVPDRDEDDDVSTHRQAPPEQTEPSVDVAQVPQKRKTVVSDDVSLPAKQTKHEESVNNTALSEERVSDEPLPHESAPTENSVVPVEVSSEATPVLPSFQFDVNFGAGDMVEQYLRLQRGEGPSVAPSKPAPMTHGASSASFVTPPQQTQAQGRVTINSTALAVAQVTPARISDAEAVRLRIQQLVAHNAPAFRATEHELVVLISEAFLNKHFSEVASSVAAMGVVMLDCPLQDPVSIVLDHLTAVCVVSAQNILDRNELKTLVKQLSEVTFKFAKIHVVVMLDVDHADPPVASNQSHGSLNRGLLTLTQAVSRFPAAVSLRQCSSASKFAAVLGQLCSQSLREAVARLPVGSSARHFHRPFLERLQHCDAKHLAHCEYLQLFPTMNFYTGAALLHHHPLGELVGQRVGALNDLFSRRYVFSEELQDQLKSFVALLEVHAGLEMQQQA